MKHLSTFLYLFVVLPIWFYLMHTLIAAAHVDRLVWFLFAVYIPANVCVSILAIWKQVEDTIHKEAKS